jgi:phasin family protein
MAKTEKTEASTHGSFDVTKAFGEFRLPGLDVEAIVATQRKNLEALTEANKLAIEGVRALAQRQAEIAQQAFADASALFHAWTQPGAPEDRLAKNADVAKQAFEKGLADARELSELTAKASTDVVSVITRRVSESFDEARLYAKKQSSAN